MWYPAAMLELEATNSHLYPGARGRVVTGDVSGTVVLLVFSDGNRVSATLETGCLTVPPHTTAKGASIPQKCWFIEFGGGRFRIRSRAG
jgi:hypothetical protein